MGFLTARGIFRGKGKFFSRVFVFLATFFILNFSLLSLSTPKVSAQGIQIGATMSAQWQLDPEVTLVGKNAERARQLLYWVFSHPGVHTAPVLAQMWAVSRNIVYVFIVIVLVAFGIGLIISRRRGGLGPLYSGAGPTIFGFTIPGIFFKLGGILLYVTFSYLLILALIQTSEIVMRFFIENVGGKDLFNVIFSGAGNSDANYSSFIGYRDISLPNIEAATTSIAIINFSSLTYYVLSIILILRTIILWLMLVLSPFLALLMPFMLIRNIGWIWVGVFFQWLFYGPVVALFLAAVTKIWVAGIPYSFDFSRVNKPEGQVYRTAINILYGGPAQTVTAGNSANYIDTFAEYLISLIMLWAAMILPWLLLRIFRDYCCEAIATGNASLTGILDRIRQYPPPSPESPVSPATSVGMAAQLPFRQRIDERIKEIKITNVENIRNIQNENTSDLARSLDLAVSSLRDLSRLEMDQISRGQAVESLRRISNPTGLSSSADREKYSNIRQELKTRAIKGDHLARAMLDAASDKNESIASQIMSSGSSGVVMGGRSLGAQGKPSAMPVFMPTSTAASSSLNQANVNEIARLSGLSEAKTREILEKLPTSGTLTPTTVSGIISSLVLSIDTIKDVLQAISDISIPPSQIVTQLSQSAVPDSQIIFSIASASQVTPDKVLEVISSAALAASSSANVIQTIVGRTSLPENNIREVLEKLHTTHVFPNEYIATISHKTNLSSDKLLEIISAVGESALQEPSVINQIAASMGVTADKVKQVISLSDVKAVKKVPSSVSIEDYEEVKKMWLKHYREAPVPVSEVIKSRENWLTLEEKKLLNIMNLMTASDKKKKQQGLSQVAEILPFMLLGGFSETEILAYLKAKYEAVKLIEMEKAVESRAKEEAKKEIEENSEENMVTVKKTESGAKEEEQELSKSRTLDNQGDNKTDGKE